MFCLEPRGGYGFAKIFPLRGIGEWSSECGGLLRVGVAAFYAGKTHSSCASSKGHAPLFPVPNSWASTPPFGVSRLRQHPATLEPILVAMSRTVELRKQLEQRRYVDPSFIAYDYA